MRQAEKRRVHNRFYARTTRNAIRDLRNLNNKTEAMKLLPETISSIDKLARQNIIHKKKADNLKSGLMKKVAALT